MNGENWRDIPGYEGYYQVSDLGRVKSFDRFVNGKGRKPRLLKGRILKTALARGYPQCSLQINGTVQQYKVHKLVAMVFINYKHDQNGLVIDHINNQKTDNRLENLQLVTTRHNTSKDRKGTSKYTGVSWHINHKKWKASIRIDGRLHHLGYFTDEHEAGFAYQKSLTEYNAKLNFN